MHQLLSLKEKEKIMIRIADIYQKKQSFIETKYFVSEPPSKYLNCELKEQIDLILEVMPSNYANLIKDVYLMPKKKIDDVQYSDNEKSAALTRFLDCLTM